MGALGAVFQFHVAAMSPATNVGAATPVAIIGNSGKPGNEGPFAQPAERGPESEQDREPPATPAVDAMTRKAVIYSVAYIRGLAELRGRNADWAEKAVR